MEICGIYQIVKANLSGKPAKPTKPQSNFTGVLLVLSTKRFGILPTEIAALSAAPAGFTITVDGADNH